RRRALCRRFDSERPGSARADRRAAAARRTPVSEDLAAARLRRHQIATVSLLFVGYAAYYFCRADLSVALPLIVRELQSRGMDANDARIRMGAIVSAAVFAYAVGKFLLAGLADLFGGRRSFLGGMIGAIVFTLIFASGGSLPLFTIAWIGNRFVQAA